MSEQAAADPASGAGASAGTSTAASGRRRSVPLLYSDPETIDCHRVRILLAEKGIVHETVDVTGGAVPGSLLAFDPAGTLPAMVDRELPLYEVGVITDYLDERYPHPPMLPVDPVSRARTRLTLHRIRAEWQALLPERGAPDTRQAARLRTALVESSTLFDAMPFFMSDSYSVLDAALLPVLWRASRYGIVTTAVAPRVMVYAERMFARPAFRTSLSVRERDMGEGGIRNMDRRD